MKIKKQILIPKKLMRQEEMRRIIKLWSSESDLIVNDNEFEIWEKDLDTGRLTQLR